MRVIVVCSLLFTICVCKSFRFAACDQNIAYNGRTQFLESGEVRFDWSGIEIAAQVELDQSADVYAHFSDVGNGYNVFIDGLFHYFQ